MLNPRKGLALLKPYFDPQANRVFSVDIEDIRGSLEKNAEHRYPRVY